MHIGTYIIQFTNGFVRNTIHEKCIPRTIIRYTQCPEGQYCQYLLTRFPLANELIITFGNHLWYQYWTRCWYHLNVKSMRMSLNENIEYKRIIHLGKLHFCNIGVFVYSVMGREYTPKNMQTVGDFFNGIGEKYRTKIYFVISTGWHNYFGSSSMHKNLLLIKPVWCRIFRYIKSWLST